MNKAFPYWLQQVDRETAAKWVRRVGQPRFLRQALDHTDHDKDSAVWEWTVREMARTAIQGQQTQSLSVLIEREGKRLDGPALWACAAGYLEAEMLPLILQGPWELDINQEINDLGQTALHLAAQDGALPLMTWLVRNGAKWGLTDQNGRSAWELCEASKSFQDMALDEQLRWRRSIEGQLIRQEVDGGFISSSKRVRI